MEESAAQIRAGAAQIKTNLAGADPKDTKTPMKSVAKLEILAEGVEKGLIKDGAKLNKAFANTSKTMAKYHSEVSKKAAESEDGMVASTAMGRTADYIENGAKWSGNALTEAGKDTVGGLRNMSGSIVKAGGRSSKEPAP